MNKVKELLDKVLTVDGIKDDISPSELENLAAGFKAAGVKLMEEQAKIISGMPAHVAKGMTEDIPEEAAELMGKINMLAFQAGVSALAEALLEGVEVLTDTYGDKAKEIAAYVNDIDDEPTEQEKNGIIDSLKFIQGGVIPISFFIDMVKTLKKPTSPVTDVIEEAKAGIEMRDILKDLDIKPN